MNLAEITNTKYRSEAVNVKDKLRISPFFGI